ncbi:6377_t:CDS:2 [Ambispora leptoticha]|uniref:Transcription factor n=1 Tax=Ambispora leptoticha TaxID=144679 RepID=A0A9N8WJZ6_9GLOM|nr:6377_t:CDS:2 [Ambispora leptoticha]
MSNATGGPDFVKKLFKMLEDESYSDIVSWGVNGDSFVVKEIDAFTKTILPRHFKHSNFASFVRQLNKYDFHKIRNSDDSNAPYGEQAWEFRHPKFQCDKRDQLDNIKRKTPAGRKNTTQNTTTEPSTNPHLNELQSQVNTLTKLQTNMNNHLHALSKNYHNVVQDLLNFQKNMAAQDQLMQNLVQYLVTQEAEEKSGCSVVLNNKSFQGMTSEGSTPFIPSEQAQKLISSYAEVARASFDQMNEISRRAQQSFNQLGADSSSSVNQVGAFSSSNSSNPSNSPITPPPEISSSDVVGTQSTVSDSENASSTSEINNINNSQNLHLSQVPLSAAKHHQNNHISMINSSQATSSSSALSLQMQDNNVYARNSTDIGFNGSHTDNNGLTVVTVGHLAPRQQTQSVPLSDNLATASTTTTNINSTASHMPHIDNTSAQRDSKTLRVRRSTVVPVWSVPPKVLLVEDDAVYQRIGSKFLQIFGCTIDIATDGITAVDKMNLAKYDQLAKYDLVLMDIVLPNLNGVEATNQIRRFDPTTPIISMTSNTTAQDCYNYFSHGMNDILAKPFTQNNLLAMLERYCVHLKAMPNFQEIQRPLSGSWVPPQFTVASMCSEEYMNSMNNIVGISVPAPVAGSVRFLDALYGIEDEQDGRQRKRAKFELLDD